MRCPADPLSLVTQSSRAAVTVARRPVYSEQEFGMEPAEVFGCSPVAAARDSTAHYRQLGASFPEAYPQLEQSLSPSWRWRPLDGVQRLILARVCLFIYILFIGWGARFQCWDQVQMDVLLTTYRLV